METLTPETQAHTGETQFLTFLLAGEEYGIEILKVQEIRGWHPPTPIPNTPQYVKGVINLRGEIVPVMDLRLCFQLEAAEYGPMTVVIIVRVGQGEHARTVGLIVDAVSEVYSIPEEARRPAPDLGAAVDTSFLQGLATVEGKMIILLDIDRLIHSGLLPDRSEGTQGGAASTEGDAS